ncbi:Protein COP1 suppressor 2 [Vitis vinifera]|uniref:Protein COP1 suppressor 2 n=1 Tax=Vitis vinifera TaxID=29760 RepID=A0A438IY46_VITVI|nr:Protein COP1 suppressor 2 [Vitis vinifera]
MQSPAGKTRVAGAWVVFWLRCFGKNWRSPPGTTCGVGKRRRREKSPAVKRRNSEESSTQWTTGIAEVQLPVEYKLRNIEETEAAKKLLQDKRLMGRTKTEFNIPSSYSGRLFPT